MEDDVRTTTTVLINESKEDNTFFIAPEGYEVTERGIEKVIKKNTDGSYITKLYIPKDIFIEAYEKFIKTKEIPSDEQSD